MVLRSRAAPARIIPRNALGHDSRCSPRPVPDPLRVGCRRDGRSVSRSRYEAQSRCRPQGAPRCRRERPRPAGAIHARGPDARLAESSEHRPHPRPRRAATGTHAVRHGTGRGRGFFPASRAGPLPLDEALPSRGRSREPSKPRTSKASSIATSSPRTSVRGDGAVKVLDFGLAKALTRRTGGPAGRRNSPTNTPPR